MKLMKLSAMALAVLTALMIACSCVALATGQTDIYTSPVVVAAAAVFLVLQVLCLIRFKFRLSKLGFYICHVGLVVTLVGGFVSGATMRDTRFSIPVDGGAAYGVVQNQDGTELNFGFQISVSDFSVERYDPEYQLIRQDAAAPEGYTVLKESIMSNRDGDYEVGGTYGKVKRAELVDEAGFVDLIRVGEDVFLLRLSPKDRSYEAHVDFYDETAKTSTILRVNDPHTHRGWKFYLMDYDHETHASVSLYAKKDPGNLAIGVGLWMLMAGTAVMCLGALRGKEEKA